MIKAGVKTKIQANSRYFNAIAKNLNELERRFTQIGVGVKGDEILTRRMKELDKRIDKVQKAFAELGNSHGALHEDIKEKR